MSITAISEFDHKFHVHFCSLLVVETADRPGLLVDLVKIITDINIAVKSGEFDTEVKNIFRAVKEVTGYRIGA